MNENLSHSPGTDPGGATHHEFYSFKIFTQSFNLRSTNYQIFSLDLILKCNSINNSYCFVYKHRKTLIKICMATHDPLLHPQHDRLTMKSIPAADCLRKFCPTKKCPRIKIFRKFLSHKIKFLP